MALALDTCIHCLTLQLHFYHHLPQLNRDRRAAALTEKSLATLQKRHIFVRLNGTKIRSASSQDVLFAARQQFLDSRLLYPDHWLFCSRRRQLAAPYACCSLSGQSV